MKFNFTSSVKFERGAEIVTWVVMILVIIFISFLPSSMVNKDSVYILGGAIVSFALLYYYIIYKIFPRNKRIYIKNITDIIFIGILIHLTKDFNIYFFALYFIPIVAAALYLEVINTLLVATIAALFIVFEIILQSQGYLPKGEEIYLGIWQIGIILLITLFCRFLALQIKTERVAKEEQIAKVKALQEEDKREKEFITLTSHQLNTPLSIIRGFASLLKNGDMGPLNDKQKDAVGQIHTNSKRMVDLVSEILSISRIQSDLFKLNKTNIKILDIINKVYSGLKIQAEEKKLDLKIEKPTEPLPEILADPDQIEQVIQILISNAISYTEKGEIIISTYKKDNDLVVQIKDTGVGIPLEDQTKIFQPFFRGKSILEISKKGTGLGLYIAKLIIEKHKGTVWAQSQAGKGSIFAFSLPINI